MLATRLPTHKLPPGFLEVRTPFVHPIQRQDNSEALNMLAYTKPLAFVLKGIQVSLNQIEKCLDVVDSHDLSVVSCRVSGLEPLLFPMQEGVEPSVASDNPTVGMYPAYCKYTSFFWFVKLGKSFTKQLLSQISITILIMLTVPWSWANDRLAIIGLKFLTIGIRIVDQ